MPQPYVLFDNVCKYYQMGDTRIAASDHVSFEIQKGEFCVILGPSGAGKTTVLNMLGGMDTCDEGTILLDGEKVSGFDKKRLTTYRRYDVGFVFQFYNLVQNLTARENVELAAEICRDPLDADTVLDEVGLADRKNNFPAQLSGGEQQRVSIARALAKTQRSCFVMSLPARWTTKPASRCWPCCRPPAANRGAPSSSSPTTALWPLWRTGSSVSIAAG